jgi:sec-independent protein translocase protein TatA
MLVAMLGTVEIIIIVAVILLIFGPSKLPQLGSGIGKMLRGFKKEMQAIERDKETGQADEDPARPAIDVTPASPGGSSPPDDAHAPSRDAGLDGRS